MTSGETKESNLTRTVDRFLYCFGHPYNFFIHHDQTYGNMDPCTLVNFNSQQVLTKQVPLNPWNPPVACVRAEKFNVNQHTVNGCFSFLLSIHPSDKDGSK